MVDAVGFPDGSHIFRAFEDLDRWLWFRAGAGLRAWTGFRLRFWPGIGIDCAEMLLTYKILSAIEVDEASVLAFADLVAEHGASAVFIAIASLFRTARRQGDHG